MSTFSVSSCRAWLSLQPVLATPALVDDVGVLPAGIGALDPGQLVDYNGIGRHALYCKALAKLGDFPEILLGVVDGPNLKALALQLGNQGGAFLAGFPLRGLVGWGSVGYRNFDPVVASVSAAWRTCSGASHSLILPGLWVSQTVMYNVRQ